MAAVSTKVPAPVLSKLPVPEITLLIVNEVPSTSTVLLLLPTRLIAPVMLLLPVLADNEPPFKLIGSATPVTPRRSSVPPVFTVVAPEVAPKAAASVMAIMPPLMLVAPV